MSYLGLDTIDTYFHDVFLKPRFRECGGTNLVPLSMCLWMHLLLCLVLGHVYSSSVFAVSLPFCLERVHSEKD